MWLCWTQPRILSADVVLTEAIFTHQDSKIRSNIVDRQTARKMWGPGIGLLRLDLTGWSFSSVREKLQVDPVFRGLALAATTFAASEVPCTFSGLRSLYL